MKKNPEKGSIWPTYEEFRAANPEWAIFKEYWQRTVLLLIQYGAEVDWGLSGFDNTLPSILSVSAGFELETVFQKAIDKGVLCDQDALATLEELLNAGGTTAESARRMIGMITRESLQPRDNPTFEGLKDAAMENTKDTIDIDDSNEQPFNMEGRLDPLTEAIKQDDIETYLSLGYDDQDLSTWSDQAGLGPLDLAIRHNSCRVAECLIKNSVAIDSPSVNGWIPLHAAAFHLHAKVLELLLSYGAEAAVADPKRCNVWHAISEGELRNRRMALDCINKVKNAMSQEQLEATINQETPRASLLYLLL